jgi:hypothetical protein
MADDCKYLDVKNWDIYQPTMRNGNQIRAWVRTYTDRDADPEYSKLTMVQRYVMDGVIRLRGRFGKPIPNDPVWISRALSLPSLSARHMGSTIRVLISFGLLDLCNQQDNFPEERRGYKERRGEDKKQDVAPERRTEPRRLDDILAEPVVSDPPELTGQVLTRLNNAVELIYCSYPRHVGKGHAKKAITKALQRLVKGEALRPFPIIEEAAEWLQNRCTAYARSPDGQAGEYTPHPSTWFNDSRYLDDEKEWYARGNGQVSKKQAVTDRNRQKLAAELLGVDYHPPTGSGSEYNGAGADERRGPPLARAIGAGETGSD